MSPRRAQALLVLALANPAQAQTGPVQRLQVGPLSRTYLLTRVGADPAGGKLPIVAFLHGLGTLIGETPLPHAAVDHDSAVSMTEFGDCSGGADVLFYRVDGSGHSVPSTAPIEAAEWNASGRRNRDVDTAQVLWRFSKAHRSTVDGPAR